MKRRKHLRMKGLLGVLVLAGILASSAYAFTASVTFSGNAGAGDGTKVISNENVTAKYVLDGTDPTKISKVNLTFDTTGGAIIPATTGTVEVSVTATVAWQTCTNTGAATWSCTYALAAEPTLANAVSLRVIQAVT
jgi:hypothetical protein